MTLKLKLLEGICECEVEGFDYVLKHSRLKGEIPVLFINRAPGTWVLRTKASDLACIIAIDDTKLGIVYSRDAIEI